MGTVALVVGNSGSLNYDYETVPKDRLENTLGHTVTVFDDDDELSDMSAYDMVFVSAAADDTKVSALASQAVPLMTQDNNTYNEFHLGTGSAEGTNTTDINIVDNNHYITQLVSTGALTVYTSGIRFWNMTGWSNDVNDLAQDTGAASEATLLEIDKDETLVDSSSAPERRVYYGVKYGTKLNDAGWSLFDRAVGWCLYEDAAADSGSADLSANLTVQNKAQFDVSANVTIRNKSQADLSGSVTIQNKSQNDLSANATIQNKSQADLSANFTISSVQDGHADLSSNVTIQNEGIADLSANFKIGADYGYIVLGDAIVHNIVISDQTHTIKISDQVHVIKVSSEPLS